MSKSGGTEEDVKRRIALANEAFISLNKVWSTKDISTNTKIKLFNSNIESILLYGFESWRTTKLITNKLQAFINK